jgi:hypothetical protein
LALKGIEINGGATKSMRLHVIAAEGVKLADVRGKVCNRLARSFKEDLGLADAIKDISVDVEEFRKAGESLSDTADDVPQETVAPKETPAPQQELVVPPLPPDDVTPLASAPQKQDGGDEKNDGKKHK